MLARVALTHKSVAVELKFGRRSTGALGAVECRQKCFSCTSECGGRGAAGEALLLGRGVGTMLARVALTHKVCLVPVAQVTVDGGAPEG